MHPTISRSIASIALALTPVVTAAQSPSRPQDAQDAIPRELVLALLNLGPGLAGGSSDIRVGKAPDDIPPELVPTGYQVLGSTTQFESSVIVFTAPEPPDSAIAAYEARLLSSGWTKPPVPQVRPMRGFVSADAIASGYEQPNIACKGDSFVSFASSYRRTSGSLLKVTYNRGTRYSMCKARQDVVTTYRSPYDEAPIPLLRAPFGAMMTQGGGINASNDMFSLSTRLSTRLTAAQVVAHYDKQMRDQGWVSVADGALEILAAHTYRRNDSDGHTWTGMLFSMSAPDSLQQDVTLRIARSRDSVAK